MISCRRKRPACRLRSSPWQGDHVAAQVNTVQLTLLDQGAVQEVHLGAADEACNEHVARHIVQVLRGIDLLDDAILHDDDAVAHGHSLGLVVGNVDEGGSQLLVQLDDLGAHAGTQLRSRLDRGSSSRKTAGLRTIARPRATR